MLFFIDTANLDDIKKLAATGLVDGVTTNPSLVAKEGQKFLPLLEKICKLVDGPVSAEVVATSADDMINEGRKLAAVAENVVVKVPLTLEGLMACKALSEDDIMVNVTLCFTAMQAVCAAKAGAAFVSPFVGRLDDIGHDGMVLLEDVCQIYDNYPDITTMVLAASLRHPTHVLQAAKIGADVVTVPPKIMWQLVSHPLTQKGLDAFLADWAKAEKAIT